MYDLPSTQNPSAIFARFKEAAEIGNTAEASSRFNFATVYHGLDRPTAIKMAIEATTEIRFAIEMTEEAMIACALKGPSPLSAEIGKAIQRSIDIKSDPSLASTDNAHTNSPIPPQL